MPMMDNERDKRRLRQEHPRTTVADLKSSPIGSGRKQQRHAPFKYRCKAGRDRHHMPLQLPPSVPPAFQPQIRSRHAHLARHVWGRAQGRQRTTGHFLVRSGWAMLCAPEMAMLSPCTAQPRSLPASSSKPASGRADWCVVDQQSYASPKSFMTPGAWRRLGRIKVPVSHPRGPAGNADGNDCA